MSRSLKSLTGTLQTTVPVPAPAAVPVVVPKAAPKGIPQPAGPPAVKAKPAPKPTAKSAAKPAAPVVSVVATIETPDETIPTSQQPVLAATAPSKPRAKLSLKSVALPQAESIESVMNQINIGARIQLDEAQIRALINLRLADGSPLFSLEDRGMMYEFLALISKFTFETAYAHFQSKPWTSRKECFRAMPSLQFARVKAARDAGIFSEKFERVTGIFKCGRCKSGEVDYTQQQTRSGDEPLTTFCTCLKCGNKWKF